MGWFRPYDGRLLVVRLRSTRHPMSFPSPLLNRHPICVSCTVKKGNGLNLSLRILQRKVLKLSYTNCIREPPSRNLEFDDHDTKADATPREARLPANDHVDRASYISMSSIKRDVKKKVPPRPDAEKIFVSRSSPLPVSVPLDSLERFVVAVCHFRGFHLPVVTTPVES